METKIARDGRSLQDNLVKLPYFVGDEFEALRMKVTSSWASSTAAGSRIQDSSPLPRSA